MGRRLGPSLPAPDLEADSAAEGVGEGLREEDAGLDVHGRGFLPWPLMVLGGDRGV